MDEDTASVAVDEVVDYCRTQARLLSGRVQTLGEEADELLAAVDAQTSELRARLEEHGASTPAPDQPDGTTRPTGDAVDLADLEALQGDLEETQAEIATLQTRMERFQELAADYTELAAELTTMADGEAAFERVVAFELEREAPSAVPSQTTIAEAVIAADDEEE